MPNIWHGVNRPPATCESCGCTADMAAHLPTLPMKPRQPLFRELEERKQSGQTGDSFEKIWGGPLMAKTW